MNRKFLITGGAGFIGSHLVKHLLSQTHDKVETVIVIDRLDYAANLDNLNSCKEDPRFKLFQVDINNQEAVFNILDNFKIDCIYHFAASTHVDRSISSPDEFIHNNVLGAYNLIRVVNDYYRTLSNLTKINFKFVNVSTDEVYGSFHAGQKPATEDTRFAPSSPYSGSKAAAHMLLAPFVTTYGLPILTVFMCNCYGPMQFPEKLIPVTILNALQGKEVRIYGDGKQERMWIYVKDAVQLIHKLTMRWDKNHATSYNIAGETWSNLKLVHYILDCLEQQYPLKSNPQLRQRNNLLSYHDLIEHVADRPGHDQRYWIKDTLLQTTGITMPTHNLRLNMPDVVQWYVQQAPRLLNKVVNFHYETTASKHAPQTLTRKKPTRKGKTPIIIGADRPMGNPAEEIHNLELTKRITESMTANAGRTLTTPFYLRNKDKKDK